VTEAGARRTLIHDATILTADSEDRVLDPGDLVIEGDRLAWIGPASEDGPQRRGDFEERIDGRRLVVIPGLINAHTHTYATLFKGSYERMPLDLWLVAMRAPTRALSEELLYLSSLVSAVEMLKTGTTTALDHFFGNPALPASGIGAEVRAMQKAGLRHSVAFVVMDMPWQDTLPLSGDALAGAQAAASDVTSRETAQAIDGAEAFIAEHHRRHPLTTCLVGPSAAHRCSDDLLRQSRALANRTGTGIHLHLAEAKSHAIRNRQLFGDSLVGRLDRLGVLGPDVSMAHGVWLEDDELDRIARSGATIVHNPASNLKLGSGVARVREMWARGVNVAVASDGPCSSDNFNMFEALRLAGQSR
jgi:5-methylthioadenosine/S-adenosylhomocysteine deaminase